MILEKKNWSPPFLRDLNIRNLRTKCSYWVLSEFLHNRLSHSNRYQDSVGREHIPLSSMFPRGETFTIATLWPLTSPCLSNICLSVENMHLCLLSAMRCGDDLVEMSWVVLSAWAQEAKASPSHMPQTDSHILQSVFSVLKVVFWSLSYWLMCLLLRWVWIYVEKK